MNSNLNKDQKKMHALLKKLAVLLFLSSLTHATSYEEIRHQVEQEANASIQQAQDRFSHEYLPSLFKIGATTLIAGTLVPLAIHASSTNNLKMECVYSALAGLFGYLSILQHAELMEERRSTNQAILEADRVYHKKLAHIHTRHYLQDIAKYLMDRLQITAKNYQQNQSEPKREDSNTKQNIGS